MIDVRRTIGGIAMIGVCVLCIVKGFVFGAFLAGLAALICFCD